ncbi:MAG TPA: redox-regulated ATPase YchF [Candidatus Saccharimonadales bacterium]
MLSIGIVGLPNVGKSTLFNSLTNSATLVANYAFATIEPNVGIVNVPDDRLAVLAKLYDAKKVIPATVSFTDIAGIVSGASKGEGLGNKFLSHIRTCQAIVQVVRAFDDNNVIHVDNEHNPKKDIDTINTELVLADLQVVEKRLPVMEKEARINPKLTPVLEQYKKALAYLNDNQPLWNFIGEDWSTLKELQLLTLKPIIYLFNLDENGLNNEQKKKDLTDLIAPIQPVFICAKLEAELNEINEQDRQELLESYGQKEPGLNILTRKAYDLLGLQSYLTAGEKEIRAWTIKKGSTAPQAAGVIHGDFERGFIAAEIIDYNDLIENGSVVKARAAGKVRTEGKTYVVRPDDVIEFRFNV